MKIYLLFLGLLVSSLTAFSQQKLFEPNNTTYPPDGVYLTFSAFRNGLPDLLKDQLIKSVYDSVFTIRQWSNTENLYYKDAAAVKKSMDRKAIWGFIDNGTLFLFIGNKFHKITVLGQISYFLESYPVIKGNMAPVVTETKATAAYRFLDMETGEIYDYTIENLQDLLERDELLYNEYKAITSLKVKKKKMFSYMERFNKEHPLRVVEIP
ncbi:MAG: hypothetical protein IPP71_17780 [Bacteroidetes bacterium]|nr:hypothetical protein [Bacteroidota bacterium]